MTIYKVLTFFSKTILPKLIKKGKDCRRGFRDDYDSVIPKYVNVF